MCGIAGYFSPNPLHGTAPTLIRMTRALHRRGPDDEGFSLISFADDSHLDFSGADSDARILERLPQLENHDDTFAHDVAFGHRRYSIIDLSPDGHQPMWDSGEDTCVSFYGEIYNYVELRGELEEAGAVFRTHSDTEVILMAYLHWGTDAFNRFNGPFALSLYDRRINKVLLARDRIGKASFYYTVRDNRFHWATEIKSFLETFGVSAFSINERAVDDFVTQGIRDYDGTFWNEILDFPPASFAWIQPDLTLKTERYWSLPRSRLTPAEIKTEDAIEKFRSLLADAVRIRQRADVPVAFELSGGMDSSAIVGLAATRSPEVLTTFTVKNQEEHVDEEPYARAVVELYPDKIDSRVLVPQANDFWDMADEFIWVEEEPFHSPNLQTNQQLRMTMRAAGFKVVIAGSAGDEVLAGYAGEYLIPFLRSLLRRGLYSRFIDELRGNTEISKRRILYSLATSILIPQSVRCFVRERRWRRRLSGIYNTGQIHKNSNSREATEKALSLEEIMLENMGRRKMNYWLRAGPKVMFGIPIEPRTPFLDYRLVEFAFTLPPEYLIRDGWFKWILRQSVKNILPERVVWRKRKMGFPFPIREWLVSSKDNVAINLAGIECPYVNVERLMESYDRMANREPDTLWRLISLALWWRKIIEGKTILRNRQESR